MNEKTARMISALALFASLVVWSTDAAHGESGVGGTEARIKQSDVTITCPDRVTYQVQPIAEWNAGMYAIKRLKFTDAKVTGRILNCNYAASSGDASTLMREMPAGYICTTDSRPNFKNWQFLCKRAVAPIKIKLKTD